MKIVGTSDAHLFLAIEQMICLTTKTLYKFNDLIKHKHNNDVNNSEKTQLILKFPGWQLMVTNALLFGPPHTVCFFQKNKNINYCLQHHLGHYFLIGDTYPSIYPSIHQ